MAHIRDLRILETSSSTGTGAKSLSGALTGMKTVASALRDDGAAIQVGDTMYGAMVAVDGSGNLTGDYEEGLYTYSAANQVTPTTVYRSSNSNAAVSFSAGTKWFYVTALPPKVLQAAPDGGVVIPASTSTPAAPPSGNLSIFSKPQGGRQMLAMMGPSGLDTILQPHLAKNGWGSWKPTFTGTTINAIGGPALTATGTATSAPWATTSLHTRVQRVDYLVTAAATTAVAGYRVAAATWRGIDGFHFIFRTCPATGVAGVSTRRCFIGMQASTGAPTDVNPSTLLNVVGVGYDAADTNWQVMVNDGSGACTKTDTGIARPSSDRQTMYSVMIFSPPGGGWFGVRIVDEATGSTYESAQLNTNIPAATQTLCPNCYASVGGTSSVVGLTFGGMWFDTDN